MVGGEPMLNETQMRDVVGATAYDSAGDKIGKVGQLFLDDETGRPEFVTVNTGLFGTNETFIPVGEATLESDRLVLPFTKDKVKDAPNVNAENGHLDKPEERRLYEYYGMSYDKDEVGGFADTDRGIAAGGTDFRGEGHDTSGPNTDDAMTRSEERVDVGTMEREAGRARLRKYVTTEQETHTVPVRKEKAVLETEPVTDANIGDATSGPDISEEEHEVVLNEEQVVVQKEAQPVERVKLGTETVTEEQTVTEDVRKEHIEAEGDVDSRR
jgi:uncharacterized protein (TIGR02271 family)